MAVSWGTTVVITVGDESAPNPPTNRLKCSVFERPMTGMYLKHGHDGGVKEIKVTASPATMWHEHYGIYVIATFGSILLFASVGDRESENFAISPLHPKDHNFAGGSSLYPSPLVLIRPLNV
jgi:hypothetical protein